MRVDAQVASKADTTRLELLEQSVSKRACGIEESMLKGLRAISEKAAAALAKKLPTEARPRNPSDAPNLEFQSPVWQGF